jgi:hypothetical protein
MIKNLILLSLGLFLLSACEQTAGVSGLLEEEVVEISEAGKVSAVAEYCEVDKGDFEQALIDYYRQRGKTEPQLSQIQEYYTSSYNNSLSALEANGKVEGSTTGGVSRKLGGQDPLVQYLTGVRKPKNPRDGATQNRDKTIAQLREEKYLAAQDARKKKELRSISVGEGGENGKRCPTEQRVNAINDIVRVRAAWGT